METVELASEETKTLLENSVTWYLSDKLQDAGIAIATKKYLTNDNLLVYLTRCNVAESSVPRVKVQVFRRVDGGVYETGYQLFGDHRFTKYVNEMIFGASPAGADGSSSQDVSQAEGTQLIELLNSL